MLKKFLFVVVLYYCFIGTQTVYANTYIQKKVLGHTIKVIQYDLLSKDYTFKFGINLDHNATSLRDLMESNNGISAVNGVFFCPASYNECGGKDFTYNERYQNGVQISGTGNVSQRVVFALDKDNKAFLYQENNINSEMKDKIYNGLSNFPLILENGEKKIQKYIDAGLVDNKMQINISRNFICSDNSGRFIYTGYVYNINLENLGDILLELDCKDAINLDAGGSSAMIYNARHIIGPGRKIMDGIIIERKDLDTEKIRNLSDRFIKKIEQNVETYNYIQKIEKLDEIARTLDAIRKKLYEKNSRDLFDEEGNVYGYKIKMDSLKNLQVVYLLNHLSLQVYALEQKYTKQEQIDNPPIPKYSF